MILNDVADAVRTDDPYNSTVAARLGRRRIPIHKTLYWGHKAYVLSPCWPGDNAAMYGLALVFVFAMAVLVEWLSFTDMVKLKPGKNDDVVAGVLRTAIYGVRTGLSYMVMLAVMSFNGGVFIVAIVGHVIGFIVFGTQAIRKKKAGSDTDKTSDL
ncbi:copper transporter 1-like [Prosopis cineraria]|uniref:copper transporter 1-like n=1 Tax=Prosopis cineraria TaxID=364024 RepID=UPI00240F1DFD|nr:copper transporter 1-like [Prosopis cineraria]